MTISFLLSPEQQRLKDVTREFASHVLKPMMDRVHAERDPLKRALLMRPAFERAVEAGLLRTVIPAQFGGSATSGVDASIFIEEMSVESPDFLISLAGPLIALAPVYEVGTPEQIERFVRPFLVQSGAPVAAMAHSEPGGSANFDAPAPAEGVRTTAVLEGDEWVINGSKAWSAHLGGWDGDGPDLMTIVCRTRGGISLIVAEREHLKGNISVNEYYDLPGLTGCLTERITLKNVRVPKDNLLGDEGDGARLTRNAFFASGASVGILAVAAMRKAFDTARDFASSEKRGGAVPIIEYRPVADVLADAKGKIEAVRLLSWRAMDAVIAQDPAGPELALHAKVLGSETGVQVITELIKTVGVSSYDNSFPIFKYLLDALAYPVIEGSNIGVRRKQLQELIGNPEYDPLRASGLS